MKTFITSLCLFALLIGAILFNCAFVQRTVTELEGALRALPECEEALADVQALEAYWDKCHNELSFSISFSEIKAMDDCIIRLRVAAEQRERYEFELARADAFDAVDHMHRLERFSLDGIF